MTTNTIPGPRDMPRYWCQVCRRYKTISGITVSARDRARRELVQECSDAGHVAHTSYMAGIGAW